MIDVPVERVTDRNVERVTTRHPVSWQRHHSFRNDVLTALRPFGTVGPMGAARITEAMDRPPDPWPFESRDPDFWVMDDQWLADALWLRVECPVERVSCPMLDALLKVVTRWKGATIGVAPGRDAKGQFLVATGRILVKGPLFPRSCRSAAAVISICEEAAACRGVLRTARPSI